MKQQSITELPPSPDAERRSRMIKYGIAMTIRIACIFAMLFAQGWWLVVCAVGAIVLPYLAVVIANVGQPSRGSTVLRPGGLVPVTPSAEYRADATADAPDGAPTPDDAPVPNGAPVPDAASGPADAERDR